MLFGHAIAQSRAQAVAVARWDVRPRQADGRALFSAPVPSSGSEGQRHPWLLTFERSPAEAFNDLIAGHASIGPLNRSDAPEAARFLFGDLPDDDPARQSLGWAMLSWLEQRRREAAPDDPMKRQRWIREVRDVLDIVALLRVTKPAAALRLGFASWNAWTGDLVLAPSRDARAAYWSTLAQTQPLVRDAEPDLDPFGLAAHWLWICENAGGLLPDQYLGIGLLGLRRLPPTELGGEIPWLTGLASWANYRRPPEAEFRIQWMALKSLYPRVPERWREAIGLVLSQPRFRDHGIASPAWWSIDSEIE